MKACSECRCYFCSYSTFHLPSCRETGRKTGHTAYQQPPDAAVNMSTPAVRVAAVHRCSHVQTVSTKLVRVLRHINEVTTKTALAIRVRRQVAPLLATQLASTFSSISCLEGHRRRQLPIPSAPLSELASLLLALCSSHLEPHAPSAILHTPFSLRRNFFLLGLFFFFPHGGFPQTDSFMALPRFLEAYTRK